MAVNKINLLQCDQLCTGCVRQYKKKNSDSPSFAISCKGIPLEYVPSKVLALLPPEEAKSALAMLDPVTWAAQVLDWHCLDPEGEVWKRKSKDKKLPQGIPNYFDDPDGNKQKVIDGKSPFHRPYQFEALRCTSKRKVFRWGRQIGKSDELVVDALFHMFTNKNFKVILIAPFQSQVELIFTKIEEFFNNNQTLYNSKKRLVKAPNFSLELHNGSLIRAFTAGAQSKSNSSSARGQSANMLIYDEADMLSNEDINSTLAMILNFPEARVLMSSTPTGKRELFFDTCHNKLYREFFAPSTVSPMWNDEMEALARSQTTELGYKHEFLAEWGSQQEGVFQGTYVDNAMSYKYVYGSMKRENMWRYCIGVDWNDTKIGTTISVVGFNMNNKKFYTVERQIVSREGWTQLSACEKIIELNRKWLPEFIYIDRGYGSVQQEVLHKYGFDSIAINGPAHPDSKLHKIVKSYDFGSQIEIRDLFTKQPIKKHAKPFLVENTVRHFESNSFFFSHEDKQLEAELRGYIVDRVTQTGLPVFKQGNVKVGDHSLDSIMLALVAFQLEFTEFGKPKFSSHIAFSGNIGEIISAQPAVGDLVVHNPFYMKEHFKKSADEHKPELNRTQGVVPDTDKLIRDPVADKMPAANTNKSSQKVGTWSWPGFERDAPPPQQKPSFIKSIRRMMKPPRRKKF